MYESAVLRAGLPGARRERRARVSGAPLLVDLPHDLRLSAGDLRGGSRGADVLYVSEGPEMQRRRALPT